MTEEIEYEQLEQAATPIANGAVDLERVSEIPMELSVEIGRVQRTVGETLSLRVGAVVTLDRLTGEPVDLLANGTPIARGEVVVVGDKLGLRVKEVIESDQRAVDGFPRLEGVAGDGQLAASNGAPHANGAAEAADVLDGHEQEIAGDESADGTLAA